MQGVNKQIMHLCDPNEPDSLPARFGGLCMRLCILLCMRVDFETSMPFIQSVIRSLTAPNYEEE